MRIGLLGGSFNPAHQGHRHASELALKQLGLDQIWWLVSPQNPLKGKSGMASFATRLASAKKLARHPRLHVTDLEAALGTRFTIDTLRALRRHFPKAQFVWLMGSDNLLELPRWREWESIVALVPIAAVARPGTALAARTGSVARRYASAMRAPGKDFARTRPPSITLLDGPRDPASATRLRGKR
jgi:nicotinate-nucleotide adenylyltransferase